MTDKDDMTAPDPNKVDAMKLSLMLTELRLPTIGQLWQELRQAGRQGGMDRGPLPFAALTEHELAERDRRRIERHLKEAKLLPGKTLDSFDFNADADDLEGPGQRAGRRRRLAHPGRQLPDLRPAESGLMMQHLSTLLKIKNFLIGVSCSRSAAGTR